MTSREVEDYLVRVAPELAGRLYVCFASQAPPAFREMGEILGCVTPRLDLLLKPALDWKGRGAAILLHDGALGREAEQRTRDGLGPTEAARRWCFLRVALHELGHVLDKGEPYYTTGDARPLELAARRALIAEALAASVGEELPPAALRRVAHGPSWIRAVCHVRHRAELLGDYYPINKLIDPHFYEISHPLCYEGALGDEPGRMAGRPFAEFMSEPLPPAFAAQWLEDTQDARSSGEVQHFHPTD